MAEVAAATPKTMRPLQHYHQLLLVLVALKLAYLVQAQCLFGRACGRCTEALSLLHLLSLSPCFLLSLSAVLYTAMKSPSKSNCNFNVHFFNQCPNVQKCYT